MRSVRDCNVAVVGGAGFLGSHLTEFLIEQRNCQVLVLDNLVAGSRKLMHPDAYFEHCDVTQSESQLYRTFKHYKTEYVFNYAAEPYIPTSFERPLHVFNTTAFGSMKVINAAHEAGCSGILQVSSAEIFGDGDPSGRISERTPVAPRSTYGAAKAAVDFFVQARWAEAKVPAIALRQFNCIGENDFCHPFVVPEIVMQIREHTYKTLSDVCVRLGNNTMRDFMYAGDAVRIAVELLERGNFGNVYNSGSESAIQIYDLAKLIGEIMGVVVEVEPDPTRVRPWEIYSLRADCSKLYSVIERFPVVELRESLRRTIKSIVKNPSELKWWKNHGSVPEVGS